MDKLHGKNIYLSTMEREQFKRNWENFEYDLEAKTQFANICYSAEEADRIFDGLVKGHGEKNVEFCIYQNDGIPIGDIDLHSICWRSRSAELGIVIARAADRGKGYGREAIGLVIAYAFDMLGLDRVGANTLEHNTGCRKALEKNGFIHEGVNRKAEYIAGRYYDRILYSILRDEYKNLKQ